MGNQSAKCGNGKYLPITSAISAAALAPPCPGLVSARTAALTLPEARCAFAAASAPPRVSSAAASARRVSTKAGSRGNNRAAASAAASRSRPPRLRDAMAPRTSCRDSRKIAARWCSPFVSKRSACFVAASLYRKRPPPTSAARKSAGIGPSTAANRVSAAVAKSPRNSAAAAARSGGRKAAWCPETWSEALVLSEVWYRRAT
mmetsp:Transcript_10919/g.40392  ORF Transcript_10919/g.40392 Transcript_10919/m.40392 type:complete len:203 (-) Transcript_10919:3338-3946(-)